MSITTPQGQDVRENLLARKGINEGVLTTLEGETLRYMRLYRNVLRRKVKAPSPRSADWEYMDGPVDSITMSSPTPVDTVLNGKEVAPVDVHALKQYMNCLIATCLRRIVMKRHLGGLRKNTLPEKLDQVTSLSAPEGPDWDFEGRTSGEMSDIGMAPDTSRKLAQDIKAEAYLYERLARLRVAGSVFDGISVVGPPIPHHMRREETKADPILKPKDKRLYIEGKTPWETLAEAYNLADSPMATRILQDGFREQISKTVAIAIRQWRPEDPDAIDDDDDDD